MTRIYLHLRDHTDEILDPDGVEVSGMRAIRKAVAEGARDVIAGDIKSTGVMDQRYRIDAETDAGQIVYSLPFKDAVRIIPEAA
jgi:hypothetical protein